MEIICYNRMEISKKRITTNKQFKKLLQEMRKNPLLAKGTFVYGSEKDTCDQVWERIREELNMLGPPIRSTAEWRKVWSDMKVRAKSKLSRRAAEQNKTGDGPFVNVTLTDIYEETAEIMNYFTDTMPRGCTHCFQPNVCELLEEPPSASDQSSPVPPTRSQPQPLRLQPLVSPPAPKHSQRPPPPPTEPPEPITQADADKLLFNLLCEIDKHNYIYIFERCKACNVNARQLKYFERDHVRELIPKSNLGVLAEFEFLLEEWKAKSAFNDTNVSMFYLSRATAGQAKSTNILKEQNAWSNVTTSATRSCTQSPPHHDVANRDSPSHVLPDNENSFYHFAESLMSPGHEKIQVGHDSYSQSSAAASEEADTSVKYPLAAIIPEALKKCKAKYVRNRYQLTQADRHFLATEIIDYFACQRIRLTPSKIEHLADQIRKHFPTEKKRAWFCRKKGRMGQGYLYDQLYKTQQQEKSVGQREQSQPTDPLAVDESMDDEDSDQEMEQIQKWLKCNKCEDMEEVKSMWRNSIRHRKRQLCSIEPKSDESVSQILSDWPAYTTSAGHQLIDIDFNHMHPQSEAKLLERWPIFMRNIDTFFEVALKDSVSIRLLKQLRVAGDKLNKDSREAALLQLLHASLPASTRDGSTSQAPHFYSIGESQSSVMRLIQHVAEVDSFAEQQPCIFLVGHNVLNVESCVLAFRNIRYELPFADALRTCFQIYKLFNLDFPPASLNFWTFVSHYLFGIPLDHESTDVVMHNIMNYMQTF